MENLLRRYSAVASCDRPCGQREQHWQRHPRQGTARRTTAP